MLRELNTKFYHQTVTTAEVESFMSAYLNLDLKPVFDQYLRTKNPPTLELKYGKRTTKYRWINSIDGFSMKIKTIDDVWLEPTTKWKKTKTISAIDPNFYVRIKRN
jgi:hypothetical protein